VATPTARGHDVAYSAVNYTLPTGVRHPMLVAGGGTDLLVVTGNADTIQTGGAGHDTFAFPNAMGHDEVTKFGTAKDTFQFNASLFANFAAAMADAS
jgi:Ca2+-binding RTX toxin-like protein